MAVSYKKLFHLLVDRDMTAVQLQQQANDALQKSIDQGGSQEEMERIARDELGLVTPGERVFVDIGR